MSTSMLASQLVGFLGIPLGSLPGSQKLSLTVKIGKPHVIVRLKFVGKGSLGKSVRLTSLFVILTLFVVDHIS